MPASSEPLIADAAIQTPDAHRVRGFSFALEKTGDALSLRAVHRPDYGAIRADWLAADVRRRVAGGRKQLLGRAVGLHKKAQLRIYDCTGGLGRDACTLAALGAEVTVIERWPQLVALLQDARERALQAEDVPIRQAAARIDIVHAEAAAWLTQAPPADAIYLDPMYPEEGKTALPQKEMQILRDLTGGDADADALLLAALAAPARRIVVKRPLKAPWLAGHKPDIEMRGTQARFDVYLRPDI